MVADYIKETGNHVLYRVTPIFKGTELVCRGVQMEGYSVEDEGDGIFFNVFCYNSQPGVSIDYATGVSSLNNSFVATTKEEKTTHHYTTQKQETTKQTASENNVMVWIPNSGSRYHNKSTCSNMKNPTKVTLQEAERLGFTPCGRCY
jgi:DNA-entry nuclease